VVEILAGATAADRVVVNPPDSAASGVTVRISTAAAAAK